jgi:hypothetical protein
VVLAIKEVPAMAALANPLVPEVMVSRAAAAVLAVHRAEAVMAGRAAARVKEVIKELPAIGAVN